MQISNLHVYIGSPLLRRPDRHPMLQAPCLIDRGDIHRDIITVGSFIPRPYGGILSKVLVKFCVFLLSLRRVITQ